MGRGVLLGARCAGPRTRGSGQLFGGELDAWRGRQLGADVRVPTNAFRARSLEGGGVGRGDALKAAWPCRADRYDQGRAASAVCSVGDQLVGLQRRISWLYAIKAISPVSRDQAVAGRERSPARVGRPAVSSRSSHPGPSPGLPGGERPTERGKQLLFDNYCHEARRWVQAWAEVVPVAVVGGGAPSARAARGEWSARGGQLRRSGFQGPAPHRLSAPPRLDRRPRVPGAAWPAEHLASGLALPAAPSACAYADRRGTHGPGC